MDFEEVGINHSREFPLTFENNGENDVTISDIEIDGDRFSINFEGEFTLEPYENRELTVTFTPDERGEFEGSLMISSDDEDHENTEIFLHGIGLGPVIGIDPQIIEFGEVGINVASERILTISNQGLIDLEVSSISSNNEVFTFDYEDDVISLEPEAEADVLVIFTPNESCEFEGVLTITSNDPDNEETTIEITGEGVGAKLWYHPHVIGFGAVGINQQSEQRITIRNDGLIDLVISDFSNGNEAFTTNIDEDIVITPDEHYRLYVYFTPTDGVEYRDTLYFSTNDPDNETASVTLNGRGQGAVIVVDPDTLQFNEVGRNRSADRVIEIRNAGEIDLNISEIFAEGRYFSIDLDTTYVVDVDGCIECTVTFAPEEIGDFRGVLCITCSDRQREEVVIPLYGTGAGPCIGVNSDSLNFGLIPCEENSELYVTITAEGLTDLTVTGVEIQGSPTFQSAIEEEIFIELNDCYELPVTFTPTDDCFYTAQLLIHSDDPNNSEKSINLFGSSHRGILLNTSDYAQGITIDDSYTYVACSNYLNVYEISDPMHPQAMTPFDLNELSAESIIIVDACAFVSVGEDGFIIVDVTDPDSLEIVGSYDTPGYAWDIAVYDGYGYVADGEYGVRVIDVLDHNRLAEVSHYDTPGLARDVSIDGEYAYVADDVMGLRIIDISDPQEIDEIGYCNTRGWSYEVSIQGNYAYVADERHGVRVIEVSDPYEPEEIGYYDTAENAYAVDVNGCHAFVADGVGGVDILDITEPENPSSIRVFYTPSAANDISISGNYIFVTDGEWGLQIIDVSEFLKVDDPYEDIIPDAFILQPAFPNPFNSVTSIRYGLPYSSHVSISIYDVSGRMVDELYNGENQVGFQTITWNAEGFRSGVYIVQLKSSSGFTVVQKVMLIR
ncbi:choice-of-anchor D domain-containing protein [bacterium]|nr:choice-of-anchor D domain-containing protein [bacterium]